MKQQLIFWSNKDSLNKVMLIVMLICSISKYSSVNLNNNKSRIRSNLKSNNKNKLLKYTNSSNMANKMGNSLKNYNVESNKFKKSSIGLSIANKITSISKDGLSEKSNNKILLNSTNSSNFKALVENKEKSSLYNSNMKLNQSPQYVWSIDNLKENHYDKENNYYNDINGDTNFLWRSSKEVNKESELPDYNSDDSIAISTNFNSISKLSSSFSSAKYKNPVLTSHIKNPQYVEKIGYYDRNTPSQKNSLSINISNASTDFLY